MLPSLQPRQARLQSVPLRTKPIWPRLTLTRLRLETLLARLKQGSGRPIVRKVRFGCPWARLRCPGSTLYYVVFLLTFGALCDSINTEFCSVFDYPYPVFPVRFLVEFFLIYYYRFPLLDGSSSSFWCNYGLLYFLKVAGSEFRSLSFVASEF